MGMGLAVRQLEVLAVEGRRLPDRTWLMHLERMVVLAALVLHLPYLELQQLMLGVVEVVAIHPELEGLVVPVGELLVPRINQQLPKTEQPIRAVGPEVVVVKPNNLLAQAAQAAQALSS